MSMDDLLSALALPPQARVDQRVPKKHLIDNAAVTATDKKAITEGIEELIWVAALKPATVGVPAFEDAERQYLEIAVLSLSLREGAKAGRLRELVHRAIPYPVVLIATDAGGLVLSLCELRHAQSEAGKMVLDGELLAADPTPVLDKLSLAKQPATDLAILYRSWCNLLKPWVRRTELLAEIEKLRREAAKETQLARRVELNLKIKTLEGIE